MHCLKCGHQMVRIETFCPVCKWDQRKDYDPEVEKQRAIEAKLAKEKAEAKEAVQVVDEVFIEEELTSVLDEVPLSDTADELHINHQTLDTIEEGFSLETAIQSAIADAIVNHQEALDIQENLVISVKLSGKQGDTPSNSKTFDMNINASKKTIRELDILVGPNQKIRSTKTDLTKDVEAIIDNDHIDDVHMILSELEEVEEALQTQTIDEAPTIKEVPPVIDYQTNPFDVETESIDENKPIHPEDRLEQHDTLDKETMILEDTLDNQDALEVQEMDEAKDLDVAYRKTFATDIAYKLIPVFILIVTGICLYMTTYQTMDVFIVDNLKPYQIMLSFLMNGEPFEGIRFMHSTNIIPMFYVVGAVVLLVMICVVNIIALFIRKKLHLLNLILFVVLTGILVATEFESLIFLIFIETAGSATPVGLSLNILYYLALPLIVLMLVALSTEKYKKIKQVNIYNDVTPEQEVAASSYLTKHIWINFVIAVLSIGFILTFRFYQPLNTLLLNYVLVYVLTYGALATMLLIIFVGYLVWHSLVILYSYLETYKEVKTSFFAEFLRYTLLILTLGVIAIYSVRKVEKIRHKVQLNILG